MKNPRQLLLLMYVGIVTMITYRAIKESQDMPPPSAFLGSTVLYGIASIVSEIAPGPGLLLGAGWTLAIAYQTFGPASEGGSGGVAGPADTSVNAAATSPAPVRSGATGASGPRHAPRLVQRPQHPQRRRRTITKKRKPARAKARVNRVPQRASVQRGPKRSKMGPRKGVKA